MGTAGTAFMDTPRGDRGSRRFGDIDVREEETDQDRNMDETRRARPVLEAFNDQTL
jgi:hypothetical protein